MSPTCIARPPNGPAAHPPAQCRAGHVGWPSLKPEVGTRSRCTHTLVPGFAGAWFSEGKLPLSNESAWPGVTNGRSDLIPFVIASLSVNLRRHASLGALAPFLAAWQAWLWRPLCPFWAPNRHVAEDPPPFVDAFAARSPTTRPPRRQWSVA